MKYTLLSVLLVISSLFILSCDKEDDSHEHEDKDFAYHAHIHSPNADVKKVGDSIHLHITFESHTGETVHHANVKISNKATGEVIYSKPDEAHVHETSGKLDMHDDVVLSADTGVEGHTDWVLEAKVWGHEAGKDEVIETVEFHVHPE